MPLDRSRWAPVPVPWPGSARLGLPDPPPPTSAPKAPAAPPRTPKAEPPAPAAAPPTTESRPRRTVRVEGPEHIARRARDVVEGRAPIGSRAPSPAPRRTGGPS